MPRRVSTALRAFLFMSPAIFNETNPLHTSNGAGLMLPVCTVPYRRPIFSGREVSIYFDYQGPASWPAHSHSQMELMLLGDEAKCSFAWQAQDGTWRQEELTGPRICVISPHIVHACDWRRSADMILIFVEPGADRAEVNTTREVWVHDFLALAAHDPMLWQLVGSLRQLGRLPKTPDRLYVESMGAVLATHLVQAHFDARSGVACGGLSPAQLDLVLAYIQRHLGEGLPIAALAREASVSRYHFIRLFKASMGLPPHQYILKCRLLRAKEMLGTGEFRVAEAAYESGFCDQSHLNRHFRKFFGFTPKALLKKKRSSQ
ncbi:MAG TPA: AraC family transcriptional regulator [Opitutaceae bacterium]|nr:AraC family transcriptional regulator [Opitutaceae bacterium]